MTAACSNQVREQPPRPSDAVRRTKAPRRLDAQGHAHNMPGQRRPEMPAEQRHTAARRAANLSIDASLLHEARTLDINISRAAEEGIARRLRTPRLSAGAPKTGKPCKAPTPSSRPTACRWGASASPDDRANPRGVARRPGCPAPQHFIGRPPPLPSPLARGLQKTAHSAPARPNSGRFRHARSARADSRPATGSRTSAPRWPRWSPRR